MLTGSEGDKTTNRASIGIVYHNTEECVVAKSISKKSICKAIVHPLALLNISDYLKRLESIGQTEESGKLLIGGLLGKFNEKTGKYSIFITFEINNLKDLSNNLRLYEQIYSNLAFIGFYEYGNGNDRDLNKDLEYTNVDLSDSGYCISYQDMIILKLRNLSDFEVSYMDPLKDGVISVSIKVIKIENLVMNTINQVNNEYEEANKEYSAGLIILKSIQLLRQLIK
ncbi:unnamed protein product [[Candida] boidinii]|nr:unnamed protein product [[Candida] boidinii]